MQKTAQAWFTGGPSFNDKSPSVSSFSLLADWDASAASQESDPCSTFDAEAAVPSTGDKVSGSFNGVSKGVRELPGSFQSAASIVTSGKSFTYFGVLLGAGIFFVFIAFTMFLPVLVPLPQKFAICFTIGSAFIVSSFFALQGLKSQLALMSSKERFPSTLGLIGSMAVTLYVSVILHSYILSVFFCLSQVLALAYYVISYFPGGSTGLAFLSSTFNSTVMKCFGR